MALPIFRRALPVVGVFLLGLLIYNMDIVFLRFMRSAEIVGFYAAAYSLIGFLGNICTAYGVSLLPSLTQMARHSAEERHLYHNAVMQIFALTLPIAVGGMFVADSVVLLVFGENYRQSGPILGILIWTILLYSLRVVSWAALVAHDHQALALRAIVYSACVSIILNLLLIHYYGVIGAAVASVATEAGATGLTVYYAGRHGLAIAPRSRFWRPLVGGLTMAAMVWLLSNMHFVLQLSAGVATYVLTLFLLGGIKIEDRIPTLAM